MKKFIIGLGLLSGLVLIPHSLYAGATRIIDADQVRSGAALLSLPTATQTLVGTSETQTLTNKTLTSPSISTPAGLVKGDVGLGNVDNVSMATERAATATLLNKTLTSPVINSPSGLVKGDVGLGNVDNTSDATKNAATVQLTNKDIDFQTASNTNRITLPKAAKATLDGLTRKEASLVYGSDTAKVYVDSGSALVPIGSGSGGASGYNTITTPDAETDVSAWTASGGTFARTTTGGELLLGAGSFKWTPSAAQNLRSDAVTIPDGLFGRNCYASVIYKTASSDYTMQVLDGSNVVLASYAMPVASTAKIAPLNFVCPTSGTIKLGFATTASAVFIAFDSAFLGEATNISTSTNVTDWVSAGATIIGATTTAPTKATTRELDIMSWRRVGDSMEIRWSYAAASAAGAAAGSGDYLIQIPTGYTIDTSKVTTYTTVEGDGLIGANKSIVGYGWMGHSTENGNVIASVYNTTQLRFFKAVSGHNSSQFISAFESVSSSLTLTGLNYNMFISVPILGWSAEPAFRPDLAAVSWSGYHDSTCSWSRTNASYGDFSTDASCALVERTNRNLGTVTIAGGASTLPGIIFTPARTGRYNVCAALTFDNASLGAVNQFRLGDGTTYFIETSEDTAVASQSHRAYLCGVYDVTSTASKTLTIQNKSSAGATNIRGTSLTGVVEWSIFALDQGFPAPILLGSVTSKSTNAVGFESVTFGGATEGTNNCTASPCTMYRNSAGISSVTRSATGIYVINFASGTFSAAPSCVANGIVMGTGLGSYSQSTVTAPTSTTFNLNSKNDSSIDADSGNVTVICTGTK